MKYIDNVQYGKILKNFRQLNENLGGNKSSGLFLQTEEGEQAGVIIDTRPFEARGGVEDYQFRSIKASDIDTNDRDQAAEYLANKLGIDKNAFIRAGYFNNESGLDQLKADLKSKGIAASIKY